MDQKIQIVNMFQSVKHSKAVKKIENVLASEAMFPQRFFWQFLKGKTQNEDIS